MSYYVIKIGSQYVSPNAVDSVLPLVSDPYIFEKMEVKNGWFTLESINTGKYVSSGSKNNITCDKSTPGKKERFNVMNGGIYCTTNGEKDHWFNYYRSVKHYKDKGDHGYNFKLIEISEIVSVAGAWTQIDMRSNNTSEDIVITYEVKVGIEKRFESGTSNKFSAGIEAGIESGVYSASATTSIEVSQTETNTLLQSITTTTTTEITIPARKKVTIYQYNVTGTLIKYEGLFKYNKTRYVEEDI